MPSGVGEDTYLFYKILKAGYTIRYEPTAYVWHNHRRTWAALRRQIYNYSKGHVAYHLTTLFRDADLRALLQLVLWLPLGHMWRIASRITGKSDYTLLLLFNEIMGNCVGSFVLLISLWRVRSQGRSSHYVPVPERNMLHLPSPLRKTQQIQLPSTLTTPDHVKR